MRHHPLAEVLNAFIGAGLAIEHVAEPGDRPIPVNLAIRARKPDALAPEPAARQARRIVVTKPLQPGVLHVTRA